MSPFYEKLMHLLPKWARYNLGGMSLVQSVICQCFSVFGDGYIEGGIIFSEIELSPFNFLLGNFL